MKYIELPQKIGILVNLVLESKILIISLMVMLLLTFMFVNKNINKRKYFALTGICLLLSLVVTIVTNNSLFKTFDNVMNNVFMNIYFPSVEFYIFILIVMLIFAINSIFNIKVKKASKINNISMFFITFFLFISFLITIANNKLDIFNKASIYTNQRAIVLLQLSTSIFVVWLLISLIIYIVNVIVMRIEAKNEIKLEDVLQPVTTNLVEDVIEDVEPYNVILENDEEKVNLVSNILVDKPVFIENTVKLEEDSFIIENPVIDESTKFTLDEYRVFNRMLKTSILLNSYKENITMEDMLNPNTLGQYTEEEYNIYKKMLANYMS